MPLTSVAKVYRALPGAFADNLTQFNRHHRKPPPKDFESTIDGGGDVDTSTSDYIYATDQHDSSAATPELNTSRLTPEMQLLMTRQVSRPSSASGSESSSTVTTPRCVYSPGSPTTSLLPSPRDARANFRVIKPFRSRTSPRMAVSLDNVDLWEESETEPDGEDSPTINCSSKRQSRLARLNSHSFDPRRTYDLFELRRSGSPVAIKRNKVDATDDSSEHTKVESITEEHSATDSAVNIKSLKRVRVIERLKESIPSLQRHDVNTGQTVKYEKQVIAENQIESPTILVSGLRGMKFIGHSNQNIQFQSEKNEATVRKPMNICIDTPRLPSANTTTTVPRASVRTKVYGQRSPRQRSSRKASKLPVCFKPRITKQETIVQLGSHELIKTDKIISAGEPSYEGKNPVGQILRREKPPKHMIAADKLPPDIGGSETSRRVKFNNFVSVKDDDIHTLEYLKTSSDTARQIKQKYLSKLDQDMKVGALPRVPSHTQIINQDKSFDQLL